MKFPTFGDNKASVVYWIVLICIVFYCISVVFCFCCVFVINFLLLFLYLYCMILYFYCIASFCLLGFLEGLGVFF